MSGESHSVDPNLSLVLNRLLQSMPCQAVSRAASSRHEIDDDVTTMILQVKDCGAILALLWPVILAAGLHHRGYCFTHTGTFILLGIMSDRDSVVLLKISQRLKKVSHLLSYHIVW